jgi:hypothetical protein
LGCVPAACARPADLLVVAGCAIFAPASDDEAYACLAAPRYKAVHPAALGRGRAPRPKEAYEHEKEQKREKQLLLQRRRAWHISLSLQGRHNKDLEPQRVSARRAFAGEEATRTTPRNVAMQAMPESAFGMQARTGRTYLPMQPSPARLPSFPPLATVPGTYAVDLTVGSRRHVQVAGALHHAEPRLRVWRACITANRLMLQAPFHSKRIGSLAASRPPKAQPWPLQHASR